MVFSNSVFLFAFLPITLFGYYLFPKVIKNYWILAVSLVFYAWNKPEFLWILLASIIINYLSALLVDRCKQRSMKRFWLILSVVVNLGMLFYFKYFNFTMDVLNRLFSANIRFAEVVLPIGISFFTFQGLSYVIDVYRQDVPAQRNIFKLGMYISMFPQLVAGPIVRYKDVVREIDNRTVTLNDFAYGVERMIIGLFKKVVIADTMAVVADGIFSMSIQYISTPVSWLGIVAYTLQIFFDFAGYSDMAIGMGRMFGFHFLENFNYPYISKSLTEFWRRWHISLSSFFRDYVYIPLGGNRRHVYLNVAIVFLLTGIWHGAAYTFIAWGIWHGLFNLAEKFLKNRKKIKTPTETRDTWYMSILKHGYTLWVVMIGWVIFRASGLHYALDYLKLMFGLAEAGTPLYTVQWFLDRWTLTILILGIVLSMPVIPKAAQWVRNHIHLEVYIPAKYLALLGALMICVLRMASNTYSAFIYFQF